MVKLEGRQWGLVAVVALTPFFFAFVLAAMLPGYVAPVLGTALGGGSWLLAVLLGLLGGAVFAGCLGTLTSAPGQTSPVRRVLQLLSASIVPVGLCLIPALCLMLAGPVLALRLEQGEGLPHVPRPRALQLAEGLRAQLPRVLRYLDHMDMD